jgi:hypothetical protein
MCNPTQRLTKQVKPSNHAILGTDTFTPLEGRAFKRTARVCSAFSGNGEKFKSRFAAGQLSDAPYLRADSAGSQGGVFAAKLGLRPEQSLRCLTAFGAAHPDAPATRANLGVGGQESAPAKDYRVSPTVCEQGLAPALAKDMKPMPSAQLGIGIEIA